MRETDTSGFLFIDLLTVTLHVLSIFLGYSLFRSDFIAIYVYNVSLFAPLSFRSYNCYTLLAPSSCSDPSQVSQVGLAVSQLHLKSHRD